MKTREVMILFGVQCSNYMIYSTQLHAIIRKVLFGLMYIICKNLGDVYVQ
jgi:hypothetical protein